MRIPNIDGIYQTKDGSVKIIVSRKEIVLELKESTVHIIDEKNTSPVQADQFDKFSKSAKRSIQFINDILT